jgi:hypothetical protein
MLKKIKALYQEYREWVRVDLIMYATMILGLILYVIVKSIVD